MKTLRTPYPWKEENFGNIGVIHHVKKRGTTRCHAYRLTDEYKTRLYTFGRLVHFKGHRKSVKKRIRQSLRDRGV